MLTNTSRTTSPIQELDDLIAFSSLLSDQRRSQYPGLIAHLRQVGSPSIRVTGELIDVRVHRQVGGGSDHEVLLVLVEETPYLQVLGLHLAADHGLQMIRLLHQVQPASHVEINIWSLPSPIVSQEGWVEPIRQVSLHEDDQQLVMGIDATNGYQWLRNEWAKAGCADPVTPSAVTRLFRQWHTNLLDAIRSRFAATHPHTLWKPGEQKLCLNLDEAIARSLPTVCEEDPDLSAATVQFVPIARQQSALFACTDEGRNVLH